MDKKTLYHVASHAPVNDWQNRFIPLSEAVSITKPVGVGRTRLYELTQKAISHYRGEAGGLQDDLLLSCLYQRQGQYYLDKQELVKWAEFRDRPQPFLSAPGGEGFYE